MAPPVLPTAVDPTAGGPDIDEMGKGSFPAGDPPATWNWETKKTRNPDTM